MFFIFIIAFIVLLYFYFKLKYFTLRGPLPGIPPHFLFGNLIQIGIIRGDPRPGIYKKLKKRFGDHFHLWFDPWRFIVVSNITNVQHIFTHRNIYDQGDLLCEQANIIFPGGLICIKGAQYKRHAAVVSPLFRRAKVSSNFDLIISSVDKLLDNWHKKVKDHIHTDIIQQSQNLVLQIFGLVAFDYDLETLDYDDRKKGTNELTQALTYMFAAFNVALYAPKAFSIIYLKLNLRYQHGQRIIKKYLNRMIEEELKEDPKSRLERKRTSLIASLVDSLQKDENAEGTKNEEEKKGLSRNEVMNEVLLFLAAGYDNISTAISWFIYLMSKNPRIQQKIKAELRGEDTRQDLSVDRLDSLVYLDCVIKEIFRLHPPLDLTARTLTTDDRLPDGDIQLYKGEQVLIPLYTLARDPQHWSHDPESFYPERFLDEDKNHHPYASIPFGGGHRQCTGQDLARFEVKVIAARLMQYVTFIDGGPEVNAGGYLTNPSTKPKNIGVVIHFDCEE